MTSPKLKQITRRCIKMAKHETTQDARDDFNKGTWPFLIGSNEYIKEYMRLDAVAHLLDGKQSTCQQKTERDLRKTNEHKTHGV